MFIGPKGDVGHPGMKGTQGDTGIEWNDLILRDDRIQKYPI